MAGASLIIRDYCPKREARDAEHARRRDMKVIEATALGVESASWSPEQRVAAAGPRRSKATRKQVDDAALKLGARLLSDGFEVELTAPDGYVWSANGEVEMYEVFEGDAPAVWSELLWMVRFGLEVAPS